MPGSTQVEFPANQDRGGAHKLAKFIACNHLGLFAMCEARHGSGKVVELKAVSCINVIGISAA